MTDIVERLTDAEKLFVKAGVDGESGAKLVADARDEIERLRAAPKVKPLEWSGDSVDVASPEHYQIWKDNGGSGAPDDPFVVYFNYMAFDPNMNALGEFKTKDEAKAAAQADYETRIRAALTQGSE